MQDNLTKTKLTPMESSQHMIETERELSEEIKGGQALNLMSPRQAGGLCGLCSDKRRVHLSASMNNTEKECGGRLSTSSVERVQMCSYHKSTPVMHCLSQSVGGQCSCALERAKQLWEEGHTTHSEPTRTHSEMAQVKLQQNFTIRV